MEGRRPAKESLRLSDELLNRMLPFCWAGGDEDEPEWLLFRPNEIRLPFRFGGKGA